MREKKAFHVNGYAALFVLILIMIAGVWFIYLGSSRNQIGLIILAIALWIISFLFISSLTIVSPNQAKAVLFFGKYVGTIKGNGLFVTTPLTQKIKVSMKVRNFNSSLLKVNDSDGNPIEISAVVVYKVVDTAKALFDVDYYLDFVEIQSETAIRHIASQYPYDTFNDDDLTLRGNTTKVSEELAKELQERLAIAGVEVIETRLNHLAYATEIANAMLQRQQARAILSARQTIVEGAVTMTQMALEQIEDGQDIHFTDDRKVQLINNLLVSIITDKGTQPVINTGDMSDKSKTGGNK
ncbi:SPFH domain-containing protein [Enterococcus sp. AZ072]|uniref:SPFH domain-containing protein n=1 Tax=unclassified Enterococcus TaxID=2608891 RepID=UPI003D289972